MKNRKVQGIIIKNHKILLKKVNEGTIKRNSFITINLREDQKEHEVIENELRQLFEINCNVAFKFKKELSRDNTTFLIDLSDEEKTMSYDAEGINSLDKSDDYKWVDLSNKNYFSSYELGYIKLLMEECIENQYIADWTNIIEDVYFSDYISKKYITKKSLNKHRKTKDLQEGIKEKIKVMIMAFTVGLLFNYFFVWDSIGVSAIIFVAVIIGFSIWATYSKINLRKRLSLMFLIPIVSLTFTYAIYNNWVLRGLNAIVIPLLIVSYIITLKYENIKEIKVDFFRKIFERIFPSSLGTTHKFFFFLKEIINSQKKIKQNSTKRKIIKGLIISTPLLIIILFLLTSADMMFKYYLENIGDNLIQFNLESLIGHSIVILIVTLYTFGFLWSLKYNENEYYIQKKYKVSIKLEPVTIITIILVICVAYLIFSIIQFSYLYGGSNNVLPSGFTYAEYARKGFFELVLITIINFIIVIFSIKFTNKDTAKINKAVNISNSLLILFTFNMLFSAHYKMNLYEEAFGFTRLRIFVQVFMLLIGLLLTIVLLGIWINSIPTLKVAIITTMIVYIALNYINVDKIIAKKNIERYNQTNIVDIDYLKTLSYDASGELVKLLDVDSMTVRNDIKKHIKDENKRLEKSYDHWYELNYYKNKFLEIFE